MLGCAMPKVRHPERPGAHLRIVLDGRPVLGPGRAALLQGIAETGSIAAAGRRMRMSYARAWNLAEELNTLFRTPLIDAAKGGAGGGGARLTPLGERMLAAYREMEAKTEAAIAAELTAVKRALRPA
jgi:molybdate transport system regulatory protein